MVKKIARLTGSFIGNLLCERTLALFIFAGRADFACIYAIMRMCRNRDIIRIKNT